MFWTISFAQTDKSALSAVTNLLQCVHDFVVRTQNGIHLPVDFSVFHKGVTVLKMG